jgi:hypothetical protein
MTDTEKIQQLTDLLADVIHALNMKQYEIEDPDKSYQCEVEADNYHNQMCSILNSND